MTCIFFLFWPSLGIFLYLGCVNKNIRSHIVTARQETTRYLKVIKYLLQYLNHCAKPCRQTIVVPVSEKDGALQD